MEGVLAQAEGNYAVAVETLRTAKGLSRARFLAGGYISDLPVYLETLALALLEKGDLEAAEQEFQEIVSLAGDRLYWPWIWLGAHVHLAELAARDRRPDDARRHAAVVGRYWGGAGGHQQPLVDDLLERLSRIIPGEASGAATPGR